jgi:hypothetical protein
VASAHGVESSNALGEALDSTEEDGDSDGEREHPAPGNGSEASARTTGEQPTGRADVSADKGADRS